MLQIDLCNDLIFIFLLFSVMSAKEYQLSLLSLHIICHFPDLKGPNGDSSVEKHSHESYKIK